MALHTTVTATGTAGWSDPGLSFVVRTADELSSAIDTLIAQPDLTIERDGLLGDKGYITIHRGRATLHLYFASGGVIRYEYADPSDGAPNDCVGVRASGFLAADAAKEAVRLMAMESLPNDFFQAHTIEDDPADNLV